MPVKKKQFAPPSLDALNMPGALPSLPNVSIGASQGGDLADGSPAPTMDYYNPMWARWFDQIKQNTGQYPVFGARGSGLNKLPTSPGQPPSLNALRRGGQ